MARTPLYHPLFPAYRFAIRVPDKNKPALLGVTAAFINVFSTDQQLCIGRAVSTANDSLHCLPDTIELWLLPRSRTLGGCVRTRVTVTPAGWTWSPINLDANYDGVALEWATAGILSMEVDDVVFVDAPPEIQDAIRE